MKYIHVLSGNVAEIWQKIKIQLSFLTNIFTRAGENDSKSWFIMFTHLHLFISHKSSSSFVCQFPPPPPQFQKSEKNVHSMTLRAEMLHCPVSFDILWLYLNQTRVRSLSSTESQCHAYWVSEYSTMWGRTRSVLLSIFSFKISLTFESWKHCLSCLTFYFITLGVRCVEVPDMFFIFFVKNHKKLCMNHFLISDNLHYF